MNTLNRKEGRLNTYINPLLLKRAKIQAAIDGTSLVDIVEKALTSYLPSNEKVHLSDSSVLSFKIK